MNIWFKLYQLELAFNQKNELVEGVGDAEADVARPHRRVLLCSARHRSGVR